MNNYVGGRVGLQNQVFSNRSLELLGYHLTIKNHAKIIFII